MIRKELSIGRALGSIDEELYLNLMLTADRVAHGQQQLLKDQGLQAAQYNVLRILRGAGDEGLPCGAIAERMITREPDMTRLIDRIEKQGLVRRTRSDVDRRVVLVCITGTGLARIKPLDRLVRQAQARAFRGLAEKDKRRLIDLLEAVRAQMND